MFSSLPASGPSFAPSGPFVLAAGGSRSLPASAAPLVRSVLAAAAAASPALPLPPSVCSQPLLSVGCCVGADELVLSSAVALGLAPRVQVKAAFGPGGVGACSLSAVSAVAAAEAAGAWVAWWAGGGAALPLRARLARRSVLVARSASVLLLFSPGAGSLASAAPAALRAGVPLWAVSPSAPAPVPGFSGSWFAGSFLGFPAWCWVPAGVQLSLL